MKPTTRSRLIVLLLLLLIAGAIGWLGWHLYEIKNAGADEAQRAEDALEARVDKHAADLATLARRWRTKDRSIAIRALKRVFALRPGFGKAQKVAEQMGLPDLEKTVLLFDGSGLGAWLYAEPPTWRMDGVTILGDGPKDAHSMRSLESFDGDYTLRMEARIVEEYDGPSYFAIGGDADDGEMRFEAGVLKGKPYVVHKSGGDEEDERIFWGDPQSIRPPLDPTGWVTYELRFRGDTVYVYMNGDHVAEAARGDAHGGYVSVVVQYVMIRIRSIELVRR